MNRMVPEPVSSTSHINFLYGVFGDGRYRIPYLTTTMSFEDAARDLNLTIEIPGGDSINWKLDELYQRDIDWGRVQSEITPYLRNPDVPQFFNSITIALLPFNRSTKSLADGFSEQIAWQPPGLESPARFAKILDVGPISLGFWDSWEQTSDPGFCSGQLRWNTREVFGVAIDGQHRLAAIKDIAAANRASAESSQSRVPVILLIFDGALGFQVPKVQPTVELLRSLFIDLNRHAQRVLRARILLLDDRTPHPVVTRVLLEQSLSSSLSSLDAAPPKLPLSLVDWHTEQAKFDTGPYVTTVLGLDWMVSQILQTNPLTDLTNYSSVRKQLKALTTALDVDLSAAVTRVNDLEAFRQTPFVYTEDELTRITEAFESRWSPVLCTLLTSLDPYAALVSTRGDLQTLSLEWQHWFRLQSRYDGIPGKARDELALYEQQLRDANPPLSSMQFRTALAELDTLKTGNLAFNVVFQRAYLLAFLEFMKISDVHVAQLLDEADELADDFEELSEDEWDDPAELLDDPQESEAAAESATYLADQATMFVTALNSIHGGFPTFFDLHAELKSSGGVRALWAGSFLKAEGTIDHTQSASARAKELIFVAAGLWLVSSVRDTEPPTFSDLWADIQEPDAPVLFRRLKAAIIRLAKPSSVGGRILKARGDDYDPDQALEEVLLRCEYFWHLVRP